jgi:hypothetical protein
MTLHTLLAIREHAVRSRLLTQRIDLFASVPAKAKPEPLRNASYTPTERKRAADNPKNFCACGNFKRGRAQMCLECFQAPITCACGAKKHRGEERCRACALDAGWIVPPPKRCACGKSILPNSERCRACRDEANRVEIRAGSEVWRAARERRTA